MPAIKPPPAGSAISDREGVVGRFWRTWFQELAKILGNGPFPLKSYTVLTVPDAASYEGHIIYISNEAGGKTLAFSDAVNWRRAQDRAIIS